MIMMPYDWPWPSPQVTGRTDFWHPTGSGGFRMTTICLAST